jgi:putative molybdopterin biosynthesis protein
MMPEEYVMPRMRLLSTRELARFLGVNEKQVYSLITEKGLPATKVTGKWLFPLHLVEQWLENNTQSYPALVVGAGHAENLLVLAGSNDVLMERACTLFSNRNGEYLAAFANVGSMGGIQALKQGLCDIACSHLLQDEDGDYNFAFASGELEMAPAVVCFALRQQGLLVAGGNPLGVRDLADAAARGVRFVNRPLGTGTRLLLDRELKSAGIDAAKVPGYEHEVRRHLDVGLRILAGEADAGLAIRAVTAMLPLDFLPLRWERFDLLIPRHKFFDKPVQAFLELLRSAEFRAAAEELPGYDVMQSGVLRYPGAGE